ncbi:transporter [Citrifermentans bremense]|uniref:transporter n=1 Tax=Citrifermentans bremense TaxID=60035 RepID=UPI00041AB1D8|nr:transporter [Citrifermentans bremense]
MTRLKTFRIMFCVLMQALCLLTPGGVRAEGPLVSTGVGFEFASGSYGLGTKTDSVYIPFTLAVYPSDRLGFMLEIPYVYQSSSAVNTGVLLGPGGGQMTGMRKEVAAMPGSVGTMPGTGGGSGGGTSSVSTVSHKSRQGVGDLTLKGGYVLVQEGEFVPRVRPYLFVKVPTADRDQMLGTGEFDEGFAVEFSKQFGNWYSFAEGGYTFQGSSPVLALKDYFSFNAGTGYQIGERFLPMLIVKASSAPIAGASDLVDLRLKLKYLAGVRTGVEGYVAKGVTRSTPDYGGGLAVYYDF